jgi:NADH-quinone oxidoreductase subunit L
MTWPLVILAFGSSTVGFLGLSEAYGGTDLFGTFAALPDIALHLSHRSEYLLGLLNVLMAVIGMVLAYRLYGISAQEPKADSVWKHAVINKFYVDELYETVIVRPLRRLSVFADKIIDRKGVDGMLQMAVSGYKMAGAVFALLQNGKVRYYALYILTGLSALSLVMLNTLEGR